jgi:hypothetical protein
MNLPRRDLKVLANFLGQCRIGIRLLSTAIDHFYPLSIIPSLLETMEWWGGGFELRMQVPRPGTA